MAAFDFDGTLTDGGSVFPFLVAWGWPVLRTWSARPGLLRAALRGHGGRRVKETFFKRLLGGLPEGSPALGGLRPADTWQRHLREEARRRLSGTAAGPHVVIVSASPECYVGPAGEELGVDGVVATRLAVGGGGLLTGGYEGKNCRGAEKYARLIGHLGARPALEQRRRAAGAVGLRQQPR